MQTENWVVVRFQIRSDHDLDFIFAVASLFHHRPSIRRVNWRPGKAIDIDEREGVVGGIGVSVPVLRTIRTLRLLGRIDP